MGESDYESTSEAEDTPLPLGRVKPYAVRPDRVLEAVERSAEVEKELSASKRKIPVSNSKRSDADGSKTDSATKALPRLIFRVPPDGGPSQAEVRIVAPDEDIHNDEEAYWDSDDDVLADTNRIGNVPLWWYDKFKHVGYDVSGSKVLRTLGPSVINNLLDPEAWKKVQDPRNQTSFMLSEKDLQLIRRLKSGKFPDPDFDPYGPDSTVEFFNPEEAVHAKNEGGVKKSRFFPSAHRERQIQALVQLIREGKLKVQKPSVGEVYDVWGNAVTQAEGKYRTGMLAAPKIALPGHAASYNPPQEYLLTEEETKAWEDQDPEDRETDFIPQKYSCLRHVPLYKNALRERLERCLDLYLCPRSVKMRLNVDPDSMLPILPDPKDLRPFPSMLSLEFNSPVVSAITGLSFDCTGLYLAIGRKNGSLEIFDVKTTKRVLARRFDSNQSINAVAFNPVLPVVAVAVGDTTHVVALKLPAFSRSLDRKQESSLTADEIKEMDCNNAIPSTWDILFALRQLHQNEEVVPSSDPSAQWRAYENKVLPESEEDPETLQLGTILGGWTVQEQNEITSLTWHPRGLYFTTVCSNANEPSRQVAVHSLAKCRSIRPFRKLVGGKAQRAAFHPSKPWLFVAFYNALRVYNLQRQSAGESGPSGPSGGVVKKFKGVEGVTDLAIHSSGDHFLVATANKRIAWFDLDLGSRPFKVFRYHEVAVKCVGFHRTFPLMYSAAGDGSINVFHARVYDDLVSAPAIIPVKKLRTQKQLEPSTQGGGAVLCAAWHPTQPWLACGTRSGKIGIFA